MKVKMLRHKETGIIYGYNAPKANLECMETIEVDGDEIEVVETATEVGTPSEKPEGRDALLAAIIKAIKSLDRNVAESFTQTGKPRIPAIEAVLGYEISARDRDIAYSAITE